MDAVEYCSVNRHMHVSIDKMEGIERKLPSSEEIKRCGPVD